MAEQKFVYATAANGITVRIPAENLESWKKAQAEIKAGTRKPQTGAQLRSLMEKK